jgi:glycerophosphoryl diester phosphodiesterase
MIEVIAHRASFNGQENTIKCIEHYKKLGIGVELDLRYHDNVVYMSHDIQKNGDLFETACKLCSNSKIKMALHIKEINAVKEAVKLLKKYSIQNCFFFDTEQNDLSKIINEFKIAEYVNQKSDNLKQEILWCDETGNNWYDENYISNMHKKNKVLYAMSFEVVNTDYTENEMISEWKRLIELGIDGICTKQPEKLIEFVKRGDLN